MGARILVAGIGNIFLGDDAFGVEVARRLAIGPLPAEVVVVDVGIRSLHLAYALLDPPELLVAIDAVRRGEPPGTVTLIEPTDLGRAAPELPYGHGLSLGAVIAALRTLGGAPPPILLVGCEPASTAEGLGLSPAVKRALPQAEDMVRTVLARHLVSAAADVAKGKEL